MRYKQKGRHKTIVCIGVAKLIPKGIVRHVHVAHPRRKAARASLRLSNFAPGEIVEPSGFKSRRVRDANNKAPLDGGALLFALASPRGFEPLSPP